jgi:GAF domain-containing protein
MIGAGAASTPPDRVEQMDHTTQDQNHLTRLDGSSWRIVVRYALGGALFGLLFPLFSVLFVVLQAQLPLTLPSVQSAHAINGLLYVMDTAPFFLGLVAAIAGRRQSQLILLNRRLRSETGHLRTLQADLDQRVSDRTADLMERTNELELSSQRSQRHTNQLQAAIRVAQAMSAILEPDRLMGEVTRLIAEHFGYYDAGIFVIDDTGRWAELRAASSEGGRTMLARSHRLRVGEQGIVGYATRTGRPRLAVDVGADAIFFDNPDLPDTRSEIALPLIARYQILGALDVQSEEPSAFEEDDVSILKMVADLVAIALDNARLFEASQAALAQAEETQRAYLRRGWRRQAVSRRGASVFGTSRPGEDGGAALHLESQQAVDSGVTIVGGANGRSNGLVAPIKIRGETIGALGLHKADVDEGWSKDQVELVETVADQIAQALEAARLFEEAQRRAEREQLIGQVGAKLRAVDDVDGILRVAVQETRRALGVSHGAIRLGTETHFLPSHKDDGEGVK